MINVVTHYFSNFILPLIFLIFGILTVLKKSKWKRVLGFSFTVLALVMCWLEFDSTSLDKRIRFFQSFDELSASNIKEIIITEIEPRGIERRLSLDGDQVKTLSFLKNARPIYVLSPMFGEGKRSYDLRIVTNDSLQYDFLIRERKEGSYIYMKISNENEINTIAQYATIEEIAW
ncbi:hypothetical protein U1E44_05905 [Arenibacter sp. GZD96]|uniref:hypothetical protein n=1 Tax=Aurantibrevibacter litoralis TaxID=3106030 RepID=UPI002AFFDBAA|nr:hypothetical protein [Arenibacter sp. GZD-96]MEA1785614.1 hypothetical protein [Arenibacter sp. GZD-96]